MSTISAAVSPSAQTASQVQYAGFGVRLVAYLIDTAILLFGGIALLVGLAFVAGTEAMASAATLVLGGTQIIYYVYFWGRRGATPGKKLLKLRVRIQDAPHYGPGIGDGKALVRLIGYTLGSIPLFLGFVLIAVNPERRGLHDFIAGTIVTREQ